MTLELPITQSEIGDPFAARAAWAERHRVAQVPVRLPRKKTVAKPQQTVDVMKHDECELARYAPAYMPPGGNWHIKERERSGDRQFLIRKQARQIVREVADEYNISLNDILSHRRLGDIVVARHIAAWRMKKETLLSFPQIGRILNRDHSTAVYAYYKIEKMILEGRLMVNLRGNNENIL